MWSFIVNAVAMTSVRGAVAFITRRSSRASSAHSGAHGAANLKKHGFDFVDAQLLWLDPDLIVVPAKTEDEPRFLAIGRISTKHWSAVLTH